LADAVPCFSEATIGANDLLQDVIGLAGPKGWRGPPLP
jgi:hypothetical protein